MCHCAYVSLNWTKLQTGRSPYFWRDVLRAYLPHLLGHANQGCGEEKGRELSLDLFRLRNLFLPSLQSSGFEEPFFPDVLVQQVQ